MISEMTAFSKADEIDANRMFYLLNKDNLLARFHIVGEGPLETIKIDEQFTEMPQWISNLGEFIENRRAPKKRENIAKLLEMSGCHTLYGWLSITYALSLIDTYWVKPVDSELTWEKVSLYTHEFNEVVAKTAFEGGLHGYNLSTTSPEYGTDGTFAKCWVRENGIIKLMKRGSTGARNAGLEPFSEFYTSQIARELRLDHVDYDLRKHGSRVCSVCDAFTSENVGYLPFAGIDTRSSTIPRVLSIFEEYGLKQKATDMFIFDAVIFNEDRHKGNFGFLVDNDSNEILDMAPLFDHNIAMLCYAEQDDFDRIDSYLSEKGPCIGGEFVEDARALLYPEMRKKLQSLHGFQFERHPKYNLLEKRLGALERVINRQIEQILE